MANLSLDTSCRCGTETGRTPFSAPESRYLAPKSGRLHHRLVNEQDGDIILDRVHAAADRTLQAGSIVLQNQGFLAGWAYKNVEKVLSDHVDILRPALVCGTQEKESVNWLGDERPH